MEKNADEISTITTRLSVLDLDYDDDVFVPLNDVNFQDGTFIYVPKETFIEQPIHILNVFTDLENPYTCTHKI